MKVFITGATGFVGRHIMAEVYASGHEILASTLEEDKAENNFSNIRWLYGDLGDLEYFKSEIQSFNPEVVIHLAWKGIPDYSDSISRVNLNNSIDLLDFILNNTNCNKILVSGSCWEYGKIKGVCKESDPVNINSYFTWAKHSLNQYLSVKCAEKDVALNWFRLFYVYGPGQREGSLIRTLIQSISAKQTPKISTPRNKNDFVYMGDVARAVAKAVNTNLPSGVYNLGSGYATSVYDICRMVERHLLGTEIISKQVLENGQKEETVNFWADMEKTEHALNMSCDTGLNEGIKQHIQSMKTETVA